MELGYRGSGETLKREEFAARKKQEREKHLQKETVPKPLYSMGKDLANFPFLQALANREELVRNGKLTVRGQGSGCVVCGTRGWRCACVPLAYEARDRPVFRSPSSSSVTRTARARRSAATLTSPTGSRARTLSCTLTGRRS